MTPSTAELERLAALCEAAGPDRELDARLALADNYECPRTCQTIAQMQDWSPHNTIAEIAKWSDHDTTAFVLPRYTASIDAAMTLVPKNVVGWRMDWSGLRAVVRMGFGGIPGTVESWAATPALALCAASLRAIAATQEQPND